MKAFFCEINGTLVSLTLAVEELKVLSMKASGSSALESTVFINGFVLKAMPLSEADRQSWLILSLIYCSKLALPTVFLLCQQSLPAFHFLSQLQEWTDTSVRIA